ncbi:MAG: cyclic-di-AMP receptor [Anaerolineaceae bacterium]|nr:cyclic-di-AMP receptor [Anaerolineaceae bacterium]
MKLIITIIPGNTRENVSLALTDRKFRVTQIASTGGFLRKGNATLLVGVEDEQLDEAIGIIKQNVDNSGNKQKGVLFVVKVDKFIHF